ncbi:Zinc finger protein [Plakobranchus ocellatus]|uniref:Zinc finger protein n=1 Tax=Plakobranchus ocellatus TaxID=259542 RepID=A0AAV4CZR4_9GAST|nr:Zinc finger protein [Plakobranchus ocellatus]
MGRHTNSENTVWDHELMSNSDSRCEDARSREGLRNKLCRRSIGSLSPIWEDNLRILKKLFGQLQQANFTVRPTKCVLMQVLLADSCSQQDIPKTVFLTLDRHYEFLRILFGMMNSGATLAVKMIVRGMDYVIDNADDLSVQTPIWEDHVRTLSSSGSYNRRTLL